MPPTAVESLCPPHTCTILVVDDDATMNEVIGVTLQSEGYQVLACGNGRDALQLLRSRDETCAILLDLNLPVMSGQQFRAAQLRDRSLAWIPVVVMSGLPEARWDAERLGAAAFIWKPVNLDELRGIFARLRCARATPAIEHRATRS